MTTQELENLLNDALCDTELFSRITTFQEDGILTKNKGLTVLMVDNTTLTITISDNC